ncbi:TRAF3-interacting protein 1 [Megalops cyprinoides]|uniref:TRAF3-interacting protein 1 n=1 Tax=Megalops cyprinoides TaxID=118141 RepID=UPI0018644FDC|nr:TRAF3-interacting protein 1 [Megalops cyprinoides]
MNGSVARKTQETLGKVIKKPPLTEKLLSRPPFRYLHDIFSEVIRTTGFMRGLYVEAEMKSDNVKDKEAKIAFLQKAIDVVVLVSGEPLSVKPARIVAGHEPEKTNELLQAIGKCCLNKLSSEEAVRQVLAGDKPDLKGKPTSTKSQDKENRGNRDRQRSQEEKMEIKDGGTSRDRKDQERPKEQEGRRAEKDQHREGGKAEREGHRERGRAEKEGHREGGRAEKSREHERAKDREREKDKSRDRDKAKERDPHRERERDREKRRDGGKEADKEREAGQEPKETEKQDEKPRDKEETRNGRPAGQPLSAQAEPEQLESPTRAPRPSSAKGQRRRPKPGDSDSDGEADPPAAGKSVPLENGGDTTDAVLSHTTHSNRRVPRPNSARPAPPRVRRQESRPEVTPAERLGSAKPSSSSALIVEGSKLSDNEEDEEQFVVEEVAVHPPDMPELELEPSVELRDGEKHGGLVQKILETKKDYETSPLSQSSFKDAEQAVVSEASRRKERDLVSREMERLRSSIQTVCRSALPLGKIMDYIQEDMDSMQKELETWRRENQEHAQALLQEQRITDNAVEPLKAELAELEQLILDQQDKICAVKSSILRNEDKIQKMMSSINFSSRV